jgi:hypothetical protein
MLELARVINRPLRRFLDNVSLSKGGREGRKEAEKTGLKDLLVVK